VSETDRPVVPLRVRQKVAEHLVRRQDRVAVLTLVEAGLDELTAIAFARSMPEYRTGLNHQPTANVELPDGAA